MNKHKNVKYITKQKMPTVNGILREKRINVSGFGNKVLGIEDRLLIVLR